MRTALLQSSGRPGSLVENLKVLDEAAGRAAAAGAALLASPEMFLTGYAIGDGIGDLAEPADGDSADAVAEIATRHGLAIAYGYPERGPVTRSSTPRSSSPPTATGSPTTARPTSSAASNATTSRRASSPSSRPNSTVSGSA